MLQAMEKMDRNTTHGSPSPAMLQLKPSSEYVLKIP